MPKVMIAEGGRSWPEYPCGPDWNDVCGPEDVDAWGRRLAAEIQAVQTHLGQLSPAGEWIGPAAETLAADISAWTPGAREWADTDYWQGPVGHAHALAYGGFDGVIDEIVQVISAGDDLNNRARVMVWEWSQQAAPEPKPPPAPIQCPEGYSPVSITQQDGSVVQFCQGTAPEPVHPDELPNGNGDGDGQGDEGGGGLLLLLGLAAGVGALALYSKRGTISSSVMRSFKK